MDLSVCIEMLFREQPFTERIWAAADSGADAIEFWTWRDKDLDTITKACNATDLDLAAMLGTETPLTNPDRVDEAITDLRQSIAAAAECNCRSLIITVGNEQADIERTAQRDAIVRVLDRVAPEAERAGVALVVEPLNTIVDHPGYFLTSSTGGYDLVSTIDSPAVSLLFDVYHQQISEGNVTTNLCQDVSQLGHVHLADVPGRHQPGTGELNYETILAALAKAGYNGYVGCEFVPTDDANSSETVLDCRRLLH